MDHAAARSWATISMAWLAEIAKPMVSAVTLLELVAPAEFIPMPGRRA